jgi:hypothetical protein
MIMRNESLPDEHLVALDCPMAPFMGHVLASSDTTAVYRRASDQMIVFYDRTVKECWELEDADELRAYLDDEFCNRIAQSLARLTRIGGAEGQYSDV